MPTWLKAQRRLTGLILDLILGLFILGLIVMSGSPREQEQRRRAARVT